MDRVALTHPALGAWSSLSRGEGRAIERALPEGHEFKTIADYSTGPAIGARSLDEAASATAGCTLDWLNRNRRPAKVFEATIASAKTWVYIASVQLLFSRLGVSKTQLIRLRFGHIE